MIKPVEKDFGKTMDAVRNAGGLFYQYRACRRDTATIYDIENIRHGVAYAQTPLNMNDPFDSMIGYSKEKFYFESIDMILQSTNADERLKTFLAFMIKHEIVGKSAEFLSLLQRIKAFFKHRQVSQHVRNIPFGEFVTQNAATLYSKAPKDIRNKCDKSVFLVLAFIVGKSGDIAISMDFIKKLFELDTILTEIRQKIDYTEKTYVKLLRDFLAKLTVSCFSSSGWDNQLMWSHYANAYKGICIEYDFTDFNEVIGFIYPIHYSSERPTLSLKDVGILGVAQTKPTNILQGDVDPASILAYLLAKNDCWQYEKEWRIINVEEEPNTPRFIKMPKIKSVTLGINIDFLCRQLLIDVCSENGSLLQYFIIKAKR